MKLRGGLTLIEVLVAIAIIGAVFAALASLQISNLRVTRGAEQDSQQLQAAVDWFEDEKVVIANDFGAYAGCPDTGDPCSYVGQVEGWSIEGSILGPGATIPDSNEPGGASTRVQEGTVLVLVDVEGHGFPSLRFMQYISCLDITGDADGDGERDPVPSVEEPGVCSNEA